MIGLFQPVLGAVVILSIAYAFSTNRAAIRWSTVAWGLGLQIVFALIVLKTSVGQHVFETLGTYITTLTAEVAGSKLRTPGLFCVIVMGPAPVVRYWTILVSASSCTVFRTARGMSVVLQSGAAACRKSLTCTPICSKWWTMWSR